MWARTTAQKISLTSVSSPHTFFPPLSPHFKNGLKASNHCERIARVFREDLAAGFGDYVLLGERVQLNSMDTY